ncbi:hypothetical protein [Paraburkholderia saeva]|jgi:hypothetical protein|uniref:hypothetical protein n=1 Tax=Paraburkholderia saeva TaxID=2777537 RepID=UPI001DE96659|nr:hypothetical protein [Paraburkholderia saeva]CAG4903075.1 hypothetical protein R52603_03038 [Paraburkholderia saeva]
MKPFPLDWISRRAVRRWVVMLACAIWTTVYFGYASKVLGTPLPLQCALVFLGFALGRIVDDLCRMWRWAVARTLHFEDVIDGVCSDLGSGISRDAVWRWYRHRGKPWWISPRRARPSVNFLDACVRMEAYCKAMQDERRRTGKNHRV